MNRFLTLLIALVVLLDYTGAAQTLIATQTPSKVLSEATPESAGFSAARLARLDSTMNNWVKNHWIAGSVALIARNGKIILDKAYGYNNVETKALLDKHGI